MKAVFTLGLCVVVLLIAASGGLLEADDSETPRLVVPQYFCDRLADMTYMPLKGGVVNDPIYNGLLAAGAGAVPCLIAEIENTSVVKSGSPLHAPGFHHLKVGDLALLMIERLVRVPMNEILPEAMAKNFEDRGYPAYFEGVKEAGVRAAISGNMKSWFEQNRGNLTAGRSTDSTQCLTNIVVSGSICYVEGRGM